MPISKRKLWTNHAATHVSSVTFSATSTESSNFIARTTGLTNPDKINYDTLITGLVNDGIFAKLDALWVYAARDTTNAVLNLVSSSFTCVEHGSPTFTAYRGYTGSDGSTTVYLDTQFNPSSGSPHYTQNSCHASAWSNTSAAAGASGGGMNGCADGGSPGGGYTHVFPRFVDGKGYYRINDTKAGITAGVTNADGKGFYLANRSGASAQQGYKNASDVGVVAVSSMSVFNGNMYSLAYNAAGSPVAGFGGQSAMCSFGGSLTSGEVTNFYSRLQTYMTAVGVLP